ncbi:MAG TPA: hypothetical protein PKA82_09920 [Pyrinomonadaceae bacterium]|nr:hypothetical protein [Pyrinomonadaceae bacterium]
MEYNWEDFEDGQAFNTKNRMHVTLTPDGKLYFNGCTLDALGMPDGVSLMYDRQRATIGVRASPLNRQSSYVLRRKDKSANKGRIITIANFCRKHHIRPSESIAFTTAELTKDGILTLDLNEIRNVEKRKKRKATIRA